MQKRNALMLFMAFYMALFLTLPCLAQREVMAAKMPVVTIESYTLSKGDFSPGTSSTVTLTLKNTGAKYTVDSVVVTYSSMEAQISPVYGTANQTVIDSIAPGETATVDFIVDVPADTELEKANINFNLSYSVFSSTKGAPENAYETFSNEASISIPITYDQSFKVSNVSVAESTSVGATTLVSISYSNNDTAEVKDIVLNIEGNIEKDTSKLEIGELPSGQTGVKDTYVAFTQDGTQNLTLSISYVDAENRTIVKDLGTYTVEVEKKATTPGGSQVTVEEDNTAQHMKIALFAVGFLLVIICVVMYLYKRNKD